MEELSFYLSIIYIDLRKLPKLVLKSYKKTSRIKEKSTLKTLYFRIKGLILKNLVFLIKLNDKEKILSKKKLS